MLNLVTPYTFASSTRNDAVQCCTNRDDDGGDGLTDDVGDGVSDGGGDGVNDKVGDGVRNNRLSFTDKNGAPCHLSGVQIRSGGSLM